MATNPKDMPRHHYSLDEYFALEQASDARFEYWDGDIVVEVTSPSTVGLGDGPKFVAYQAIPTLREYLLVSQDEPRVTHYARREDGAWERRDVTDADASVELESVGCAMKMRDVYDGLTFLA